MIGEPEKDLFEKDEPDRVCLAVEVQETIHDHTAELSPENERWYSSAQHSGRQSRGCRFKPAPDAGRRLAEGDFNK